MLALRDWMRDVYAPAIEGAPDPVGRERYARWSRLYNGTDLDLDEAYAYGWSEYHRLLAEMKTEAEKVLPGAGPGRRSPTSTFTASTSKGWTRSATGSRA